jgi:hypothetical protein
LDYVAALRAGAARAIVHRRVAQEALGQPEGKAFLARPGGAVEEQRRRQPIGADRGEEASPGGLVADER